MLPLFALTLGMHAWMQSAACLVTARVPPPWKEGDKFVGVVNLTLTNPGDEPLGVPWRLRVSNPHYGAIRQAWNLRVTETAGRCVEGVAEDSNQVLVPTSDSGAPVNVGFTVEADAPALIPCAVWVNDMHCELIPPSSLAKGDS